MKFLKEENPENMARKTACMGLLCAAALILGYVESLIPSFPGIPGMKLGLPNVVIVTVLYRMEGTPEASSTVLTLHAGSPATAASMAV